MKVTLKQQDACEFMSALPASSVDLMITDLPYESLEKHRSRGTTTRLKRSKSSSNDWFDVFPNYRIPEFFALASRALRPSTHLYVFCDDETSDLMKRSAREVGLKVWKRLVWDKLKIGMGYHYRAQYEFVLFCEKPPGRQLTDKSIPDVLRFERVWNGYPTEKPVDLLSVFVRQSARPGEVVCDPFMGSGSTGVAAVSAGCHFLGSDTSTRAMVVAGGRLMRARGTFAQEGARNA